MQQRNGRNNAYASAAVYRKICTFCGKEFTCLKSSTHYCSHRCSSLAYKQRKKDERNKVAEALFRENRNLALIDRMDKMELLSPSMAALYLGMNRTTVYRYISAGALPSIRIGNSTRIRKNDLDNMFCASLNPWGKNRKEYCTVKEASEKFGIPYSTYWRSITTCTKMPAVYFISKLLGLHSTILLGQKVKYGFLNLHFLQLSTVLSRCRH